MRRAGGLAAVLLALLAAGCGEPTRGATGAAPPSIILISLDTLRADALTPYGYSRPTSPVLARFARESVRFADAQANATATLPSHLSLLTSLYPPQLGITRDDGRNDTQARTRLRLADGVPTLAGVLREHGYQTLAFTDGGFVHPCYGLDQGFDRFEVATGPHPYRSQLPRTARRLGGELAEREARGERAPLFLFLHSYDVHEPYDAPPPFARAFSEGSYADFERTRGFAPRPGLLSRERGALSPRDRAFARALYDSGVRATDARVFRVLRRHGLYDGALIAIVSDHGEEFLEHGDFGHGPRVYQELARVPWLLRLPGAREAGRVVEGPVALVDLAPTLLDLAGLPVPGSFAGRSLRGLIEGRDDGAWLSERSLYVEAPDARRGAMALRRGREKLVIAERDAPGELYDLAEDPGEARDLSAERPERTAALREELLRWNARMRRDAEAAGTLAVESDVPLPRDALRELGYVD